MLKRPFLTFTFLFLIAVSSQAEELTGQVSWIYDGDTLKVEQIGKVRLLGIDTPEYKASSRDRFYKKNFHIQAKKLRQVSRQAKHYNMHHVKGKQVRLEVGRAQRDKHDRLLAYVYLPNGDMLNLLLLENGLATVFRRYDFLFKEDFLKAEKKARKKALGLWSD